MSRSDRLDRSLLAAVGLVLVAAATSALLRSYGGFGAAEAHEPILIEPVRTYVGRNHDWFWPVAFVAALTLAYLGYRVLRTKLIPHPRPEDIHDRNGDDDLVIASSVVSNAIAEDLTRERGIVRARARLVQTGRVPELDLELTLNENNPIADLRRTIQDKVLERAKGAMESPPISAHVTIALADIAPRRVN
jgi:hypothetical protein